MKKYLYLFLLGLFLFSACSNNLENFNKSEEKEHLKLIKSVNNMKASTESKIESVIYEEEYEDDEDGNSISGGYKIDLNYIKNVWGKERTKKSVVFDTEVSIPENWIALDSTSGSFYTDSERLIFIYMDVADGMNDVPTELDINVDIDKFCEEADKHFIKSLALFTRGEFVGDLRIKFFKDSRKVKNEIQSESNKNIQRELYKNSIENIKTIKSDFGEYYLREGVLSDDMNEYYINSSFINTAEKDGKRPFMLYIYAKSDRVNYLFESIVSDVFEEIAKQN